MPPPVVGQPIVYHQKWDFVVEIDNVFSGGFMEASGLDIEQKISIQREGGNPTISDISYTAYEVKPVTLKRGASNNPELYNWWDSIRKRNQDLRNVSVVAQRNGLPFKRYNYDTCALTNYKDDGLDRTKEEDNVIEEITLQPKDAKVIYLQ